MGSRRVKAKVELFDTEKGVLQIRNKKLTQLLKLIPAKHRSRYALMHLYIQKEPPRMVATDGRRLLIFSRWHTNEPVENGLYYLSTEGILTKATTTDIFPKYEDIIPKDYNVAYKLVREDNWITRVLYGIARLPNNLNIEMLWPVLKALEGLKPYETIVQSRKIEPKLDSIPGNEPDYAGPSMIVAKIGEGQITYIQMPLNSEFMPEKIKPNAKSQIDEEKQNEQTRTNGVQRPSECETAQSG